MGTGSVFSRSLALLTGAVLAVSVPSARAEAQRYDRLVILGDSLSDTGNAGRFSNGPVWVEHLAERLDLSAQPSEGGGWNFAIGGARLNPASGPSSLPDQLDRYLARPPEAGRTLHVVFGGGNDLLAAVTAPAGEQRVDEAAGALTGIVAELLKHGATDLLVPNLPDVGITPAIRSYGRSAQTRARVLTDRFNAAVERGLGELDIGPHVRLHRLDVYAIAERVRNQPHEFGITDATTPCGASGRCDGHLFWDHLHPTSAAHARLAEAAAEALATLP